MLDQGRTNERRFKQPKFLKGTLPLPKKDRLKFSLSGGFSVKSARGHEPLFVFQEEVIS